MDFNGQAADLFDHLLGLQIRLEVVAGEFAADLILAPVGETFTECQLVAGTDRWMIVPVRSPNTETCETCHGGILHPTGDAPAATFRWDHTTTTPSCS